MLTWQYALVQPIHKMPNISKIGRITTHKQYILLKASFATFINMFLCFILMDKVERKQYIKAAFLFPHIDLKIWWQCLLLRLC